MEGNANSNPNQIDFVEVPIVALRQQARSILSRSLNPGKVLPSEDGFPRDWRGIAHLAGLQSLYGPSIHADADPMKKVLALWCTDGDNQTANFDNLVKFLGVIDRWDVADDLSEALLEDAHAFQSGKHQKRMLTERQNNMDVFKDNDVDIAQGNKPDPNILTMDDVVRAQQGLPPQIYDAFLLFADKDVHYASELVDRMEEDHPRFGFKLCLKDRDLIGGISFEHEAILRLIAERCNRLIVIVSSAFLDSPANKFFVNFAQALQIEQQRRKIVPCLYENCVLPPILSYTFHLKYHQSGKLFNFWEKLSDSIRSTNALANGHASRAISPSSFQITEIPNLPVSRAIEAAPSNDIHSTTSAPVKKPRKKGTKLPSAEPMKVHSKPEPKIRSAFSMIQVNSQTPNGGITSGQPISVTNCDTNQSLSDISTSQTTNSKSKWYKKILSSTTTSTKTSTPVTVTITPTTKSCEAITKPKSKRSWLKKRLTSSTT